MTLAETVLALTWVGVTLYALLAGADFGGGFWDLVAGGAQRGRPQRELIERSIGPVWEANHVWLIFALVVLWTAFPRAFAPIVSTLYIPLTAAAIGIILRGAAFVFRKSVMAFELKRVFGATFAFSSVVTPFFLGAVAGGVASGRVPLDAGRADVIESWVNPTSMLGGTLAVVVCAFLAAVYLAADATREGARELAEQFRLRALGAGMVAGAVALAGVFVLREDAPSLFDGLTGRRGVPLMIGSAIAGLSSLGLLWQRRFTAARIAAALAVVAVVWGWAAGQYPWLLEDTLTIETGAGARATLVAVLASLGVGALLFGPPLVWLLVLAQRGALSSEGAGRAVESAEGH